jgi:hypothetical protein
MAARNTSNPCAIDATNAVALFCNGNRIWIGRLGQRASVPNKRATAQHQCLVGGGGGTKRDVGMRRWVREVV